MMKWKVMRTGRCNSIDHEDVRKSLEILDNVLAEFDDGVSDTWNCFAANGDIDGHNQELAGDRENDVILERDDKSPTSLYPRENSFKTFLTDGATSQSIAPAVFDEDKKFSPPPVPKRNPGTRLSNRDGLFACNSIENIYSNDVEIRRNVRDHESRHQALSLNESSKTKPKFFFTNPDVTAPNDLSNQSANGKLMSMKNTKEGYDSASIDDNDEVFVSRAKLILSRSASAHTMTTESLQTSPSVASRRALYERTNIDTTDSKRQLTKSDSDDKTHPVTNSPFLKKKFNVVSSPVLHTRNASDSTHFKSSLRNKSVDHSLSTSPSESQSSVRHGSSSSRDVDVMRISSTENSSPITKDRRIAMLDKKFAKVKHLLKTKQILPLDSDPPHFVPTPPPKKVPRTHFEGTKNASPPKSRIIQTSSSSSSSKLQDHPALAEGDVAGVKCPVTLVNTITDISCILPTDTLNRPHLGLSYSMEEDLNPGVKEILTSTPKSDKSVIGLSTFSQSVSSLGYGSGQSDLDLNLSLREENKKIPVTSLKSQTLPTGMKLGPPLSYVTDIDYDCDTMDRFEVTKHKTMPIKNDDETGHFRSSSAPPLKHLQRKNKFGMSRKFQKETKEKDKKDDTLSLKSDISVDDGIILRKITTLDGGTEISDLAGRKQTSVSSEEKTKRRSVWKSILRRK